MDENEIVCPKCGGYEIEQSGLLWRGYETDEVVGHFTCECGHDFQKFGSVKWYEPY